MKQMRYGRIFLVIAIFVACLLLFILMNRFVIELVIPSSIITEQESKEYLPLINIHEHIQDYDNAMRFLRVMDKAEISKTVLLGSPELTLYSGRTGFTGYD